MERLVVHLDMDAFFAAIEVRDRPELAGKPVIVGAPPTSRRGVVSTCSYEARRYGVRSAQPIQTAARLCPEAVFLPVDMPRYRAVARQVAEVLHRFTPLVEPVSIDEAFLDMTPVASHYPGPEAMGRALKDAIRAATQLTASVGIAPNKSLAKIACDTGKPDGLVVWTYEQAIRALAPMPVRRLWGVGPNPPHAWSVSGSGPSATCRPPRKSSWSGSWVSGVASCIAWPGGRTTGRSVLRRPRRNP